MYDKNIFAKNLKHYLEANNMKQGDLCGICGVGKSSITAWCNGTMMPRIDKIEKMADYFGIKKSDLLEEKKEPTKMSELREEFIKLFDSVPEEKCSAVLEVLRSLVKNF